MNNDYFGNKNKNKRLEDCNAKIEYLKSELSDKEKCKEFSKKICEYIKNSK